MTASTIGIVGAGLAGGAAAEALRKEGFDGRVVLVGEEPHQPYSRPPLSKELLRGEASAEEAMFRPWDWYDEHGIELWLGVRATHLDPARRSIELADGRSLVCDEVLLATGGRARSISVPGADLDGIYTLRTLEDALGVRRHLEPGAPVVVIGAGFIGAEVAASARMVGCEVTVLEIADVPLSRVVGAEVGRIYTDIHRERGINLRTGVGVERFEGNGSVRRVIASDGAIHEAVVVVVGVGIEPDVACSSGVEVGNGVLVNEYCETSIPHVYAAGDVAYHPNTILGRSIRVEQWQNAQHQAAAAARNMLGQHKPFVEVPWFWSDQYDLNLQMAGLPSGEDHVVFRGDVAGREFSVFYVREGLLSGVVGVNRVLDVRAGRRLIHQRVPVSVDALGDESVNLAELVGGRTAKV